MINNLFNDAMQNMFKCNYTLTFTFFFSTRNVEHNILDNTLSNAKWANIYMCM